MIRDPPLAKRVYDYFSQPPYTYGELGCILSHLTTIRDAYLAGDEMALVMEDDIAPFFLPYWTVSLQGLVDILEGSDQAWDSIQLHAITVPTDRIWETAMNASQLLGGQLLKAKWRWSAGAYLLSRRGMEKVVDMFFTDRSSDGGVLLRMSHDNYADAGPDSRYYLPAALQNNFIVMPSMFLTHDVSSHFGALRGFDTVTGFQDVHKRMWRLHIDVLQRRTYPELFSGLR
jgi:hypothetical protein